MSSEIILNMDMLKNIKNRYTDLLELYDNIKTNTKSIKMSRWKRVSLYGMFLPEEYMKYCVSPYKGKLAKIDKNIDFKYYFDKNNRLILTERYNSSSHKLINLIFYFYNEKNIEIVWYCMTRSMISMTGKIEYDDNGKINKFFQSDDLGYGSEYINGYKEDVFTFSDDRIDIKRNVCTITKNNPPRCSSGTRTIKL